MKSYKNLSAEQKRALLKLPVYISLLAATDNKLDEAERLSAIKLAYIRSFSCEPLLAEFYIAANREFENIINQLERDLPKQSTKREEAIKGELLKLDKIISKLGNDFNLALKLSMKTFKEHVSHAHHSVIEDFLLPIPISGLTD